jgi:serine/threonine protein kinase
VGAEVPDATGGLLAGLGPGSRVADYRLGEVVGAGGMAVVFRAVDERLDRQVALKIMAPTLGADVSFRQRFIREARAAAAVDDPHVIPVHEAGEAGGILFIAMRYVPGGDVRSLLRQDGSLAPSQVAAIVTAVASALDSAHAAGLVHRDVKPANILVDARPGRAEHVYLSDFGLSKGVLSSVGLTGSGFFMGTPNYTAPEQIQGGAVSGRADQYALACTAFELLVGEAPFQRDDGMAVIWAHLQQQPPSLSARRPGLPETADLVLGRALAKNSEDRFGSCGEFASALCDALGTAVDQAGMITSAPRVRTPTQIVSSPARTPPGPETTVTSAAPSPDPAGMPSAGPGAAGTFGHLRKSGPRRGRAIAAAVGAAVVITAAVVMIGQNLGHHRAEAATGGNTQPRVSPAGANSLPNTSPGSTTTSSRKLPGSPDAHPRTTAASSHVPAIAPGPVATFIPTAATLDGDFTDRGSRISVLSVAISPDGQTLATGDLYHSTFLWNAGSGQLISTLTDPGFSQGVSAVAFSPDGRTLATGDLAGGTFLWDVATGQRTATLFDHNQQVKAVAFSPDGTILATGDGYSTIYLWQISTRRRIATFTDPTSQSEIAAVAFSPDGRILAASDNDGSTYLWDLATGQRIATLTDPGSKGIAALTFSPDGTTLATGDYNSGTYLWDVETGQRTATITSPGATVWAVAFSPDLRLMAISNSRDQLQLWLVGTRKLIATMSDPDASPLQSVAFSQDDHTIIAGDASGSSHLWKLS